MNAWTLIHFKQLIPTLLVLFLLSILAAKLLEGCSQQTKYIPLKVISVLLLALEVAKQIKSVSADGVYDLFSLPFHYCSLFLLLLPLHAFYHGKHKHIASAATLSSLGALAVLMLLMPAVIYSDVSIQNFFVTFIDFHTVVFHSLCILYLMLTITLRLYEFKNTGKELLAIGVFLAIYLVIATFFAYTLEVNFHNLYRCNITFIDEIRLAVIEKAGAWGTVLYVGALSVVTVLFTYATYFLVKLGVRPLEHHQKAASDTDEMQIKEKHLV